MAGRLADKATFVTGAASGIGRETARLFAREGATVFLGDIDRERGACNSPWTLEFFERLYAATSGTGFPFCWRRRCRRAAKFKPSTARLRKRRSTGMSGKHRHCSNSTIFGRWTTWRKSFVHTKGCRYRSRWQASGLPEASKPDQFYRRRGASRSMLACMAPAAS